MIVSVVIEDFCQIPYLEWNPPPGISAVVGPNGSGKSNAVAALAFAVSGDSSWAKGCVPPSGKNPKVTVRFRPSQDSEDLVTVSRTVAVDGRGASATFSYRDRTESGSRAVTAAVSEVLGADPAEAAEAFVCRQGKLTDVADAAASDRLRWVAKSVGLSAAEVAWDALGDIRPPAVPPDVKSAQAEYQAALSEKQRCFSDRAAYDSLADLDAMCRKLSEQATGIKASADAWDRAKAAFDSLESLNAAYELAASTYAELEGKVSGSEEAVSLSQSWARRDRWLDFVSKVSRSAELAVAAKEAAAAVPDMPPKPPEWDECVGRKSADEVLVRLGTSSKCPTCQSDFSPELAKSIVEASARLAKLAEMTQTLNRFQSERAAKLAESQRISRLAEQAKLAAETSATVEEPEPSVPRHVVNGMLSSVPSRQSVMSASSAVNAALARLTAARAEASKLSGLRPDVVSAMSALHGAIDRKAAAAAAEEAFAAASYRADAAAAALKRAEVAVAVSAKEESFYAAASAARSALHRSACPADAAAQFADRLAAAASDWLFRFNLRFSISISADGSVTADFDGKQVPSFKLSGAEKTLLGLAWRLAVMDAVAGRFHTLILDEPTYGLDETRLDAVRAAIAEWRDAGTDRQVILVTHDRRLAEIAGSAFDVSAAKRY